LSGRRQVPTEEVEHRLASYASRIEKALEKELMVYSDSSFYKLLKYATEGGKRIRPTVLLLSSEALGMTGSKPIDAAVAIELLHTESIIHDDIIDEEAFRRNKVAFHIQFGFSTSLLTADFVFAMVLSIASRYDDRRVAEEISKAASRMAEGEYNELLVDPKGNDLEWEKYIDIVENKTASLFQASAKLGAIIAGGNESQVAALSDYGRCLGIIYQIRDDLLDWNSKDKITYNMLRKMGEKHLREKMNSEIKTLAERAKNDLTSIPSCPATNLLEDLVNFAIFRER
jgi:octaprenyl-diphosphate synthase